MNHRIEWRNAVNELKEQMKSGPVEILTGPCAGLTVKDAKSLHEYACRLDDWMFPPEPMRVYREVAVRPLMTFGAYTR
jgi:hypothetical protein